MLRLALLLSLALAAPAKADTIANAVNEYRAQYGQSALSESPRLNAAAARHAADMARRDQLSHYGRNGSKPSQRAKQQGYRYCFMAENIANAPVDTATVLRLWIESPDHKKNFLHHKARDFGIGKSGKYWVMMLGSEDC